MGNFTLKPGASAVFLPGAGRVLPGVVLSGEQFRRFVPQFLVEMPEAKTAAAHPPAVIHLAAAPKEVPPPAPKEEAAPVSSEPVKKPAPSAPAAKLAPESPPAEAPAIMTPAAGEPARREKSPKKKG